MVDAEPRQLSIGDFVRRQARRHGPRRLAVFEDGRALGYDELDARSEQLACGLAALGLPAGASVGLMLDSSPEFLVASIGIAKAGLQEVPLHTAQKGAGLTHILRSADIRVVVTDACFRERLHTAAEALPAAPLLPDVDDLLQAPAVALPRVSPLQTSTILFTSGTTGLPKGVVRSHRADLLSGWRARVALGYGPDDVLFNVFPLAHINAKCNTLFGAMLAGASVVLYQRFSASGFWDAIRRHGATSASFQGAMLEILWKTRQEPDRVNPLRTGRAAPVPVHLHREFEAFFDVRLHESYGSTETGLLTVNLDRRLGSIGREIAGHFEFAVLDENDDPVADGRPGLLAVRPRVAGAIFSGYLGQHEATLRTFRNLWHHTGDVVVRDEDGNFAFVRRDGSTIRRRGENITPWEVEQAVGKVAGVLECTAYGVPSELGEEEVMVAIVAVSDGAVDPAAVLRQCEAALPRYAVPRYLRFVAAIPKNDSQKPVVTALKSEGVTGDTWERPA
ncbi:MAG: AMP-binding protein [Lautropia sp.]